MFYWQSIKKNLHIQRRLLMYAMAAIICLCVFSPAEAAPRKVKVGYFSFAPFIYKNDRQEPAGLFVDLLNKIAAQEHWQLEYVFGSWSECYIGLKTGSLDLLPGMVYSHERSLLYDFNSNNTITLWGQIFVRHDSRINKLDDLNGKIIAIKQNEQNGINFITLAGKHGIDFIPWFYSRDCDGMEAVRGGKCDAMTGSQGYGFGMAKSYKLKPTAINFTPSPHFFAVAHGKNADLLKAIDRNFSVWLSQPDSFYFNRLQHWVGNQLQPEDRLPLWLVPVLLTAGGLIILFIILIILLRAKVERQNSTLKSSEARLRLLFNESTHFICELDPNGEIRQANRLFCSFLKKTSDEIAGFKLSEVLFPAQQTSVASLRLEQAVSGAINGREETFDTVLKSTERVACVIVTVKPIFGSSERPESVICEMRDISQFKNMENMFQSLFDQATDAIIILDRDIIIDCNRGALAMFGAKDKTEMVNRSLLDFSVKKFIGGKSIEQLGVEKNEATKDHQVQFFEWEHMRADGQRFWVEVNLSCVEIGEKKYQQAFIRDVSARKKADAERDLLFAAIEQSVEAVIVTDAIGTVQYINTSGEALIGMDRKAAIGQRFKLNAEDPKIDENEMFSQLNHGRTWQSKYITRNPDGKSVMVMCRATSVKSNSKTIADFVITLRDISYEEDIEKRLRQSQKFDAIGQLAGGIAHDFNNLLQVVIGFSGILKKRLSGDPANSDLLNNIIASSERGRDLIRQLMTFSHYRKADEQKAVDVNRLIADFISLFARVAGEHIDVKTELPDGLPEINCDKGQIEQVFMNICVNARDAMPNGGTLTLRTGVKDFSKIPENLFYHISPGRFLEISAADTGTGMEKEQLEHIFEPFYTTKETGKGTGLGLSNVYAIVRNHSGFIDVISTPGAGTTFNIYLPLPQGTPIELPREEQHLPPPVKSGFVGTVILLCEDEDSVRELGKMILEDAGFKVLTAVDGVDSIRVFEENQSRIDLVLLDSIMPKKSGREVFARIRELSATVPVIFVSGYYNHVEDQEDNIIAKPYDEATLLTRINSVLKKTHNISD